MHTRTEPQGMTPPGEYQLFIATLTPGGNQNSETAITHVVGSQSVTVHSNEPSWGAVPITGKEKLLLLRDALIEVCKMEGI